MDLVVELTRNAAQDIVILHQAYVTKLRYVMPSVKPVEIPSIVV
jgi:hypothetical protein